MNIGLAEARPGSAPVSAPLSPAGAGTARNALVVVAAAVIIGLLNYVLNVFMGWALPVEEYGRVGVVQTLILISVWFLSSGFPLVVTRAIAQARGVGPLDSEAGAAAWRTYKSAWLATLLLTILVMAFLVAAFNLHWLRLESTYAPLVTLAVLNIGALGISVVPDAGLQGLFRFARLSSVRVLEAGTNTLVSAGLVLAGLGAAGVLAGATVAAVLTCALSIWLISDSRFWLAKGWGGLGTVQAALPMTLAVFGGIMLSNADLLAVKFLSGSANSDSLAGAYQVASVLARVPFYVGAALVSVFYPRIAQEQAGAGGAARGLLRAVGIGVLPLNVILVAGAPAVVAFFFPVRYGQAAAILPVLAVGSGFLVVAGALAAILQASHRTRDAAAIMSGAVVLQLPGLFVLVPLHGALGAAVASAAACAAAVLLLAWRVERLGVVPGQLRRQAAALLGLALLILPLTLFFTHGDRPAIAVWVAAAAGLFVAACFVLHLLDAADFGTATHSLTGAPGIIARRLLAAATTLNQFGTQIERLTRQEPSA